MEEQSRSSNPIRLLIALLATLASVALVGVPALAQGKPVKIGRVGCPHCVNDGSPISQSLQKADDLYASFKTKEALSELLKVLQIEPQNSEALSKISRIYIDIGDVIPETSPDWQEKKMQNYRAAEDYARRAVKANPNSTWSHFYVAASLGSIAAVSPVDKQIDLAGEIRGAVEKAIALDPANGFAYHVYGVWHRKIAEVGKMSRVLATVWYGRSLPKGDLEKSVKFLKKAISINPDVIVSRLELARSHAAREEWSAARTLLKSIAELPEQFSDDAKHKQKARELLDDIKDR